MSAVTEVHVLGVRHHGPGSARAVAPRSTSAPDVRADRGAARADALVRCSPPRRWCRRWRCSSTSRRPGRRRLLAVRRLLPRVGGAALGAGARRARSRFIDLPAAHDALGAGGSRGEAEPDAADGPTRRRRARPAVRPIRSPCWPRPPATTTPSAGGRTSSSTGTARRLGAFAAVGEAMAALRENCTPDDERRPRPRREACMRQVLRGRAPSGAERIAVVCGAWHAPALEPATLPRAPPTRALLKGCPRSRSRRRGCRGPQRRLAWACGYGAGVDVARLVRPPVPGARPTPSPRWLTARSPGCCAAEDLRRSRRPQVIEAVRLADALAAMRGPAARRADRADRGDPGGAVRGLGRAAAPRRTSGWSSATPSARSPTRRRWSRWQRDLDAPAAAPAAAARAAARRLLELDLRKPNDLRAQPCCCTGCGCSASPWGRPADARRTTGTFREAGRWTGGPSCRSRSSRPAAWARPVAAAATAALRARRGRRRPRRRCAAWSSAACCADLPDALDVVDRRADRAPPRCSATSLALLAAVEPLARAAPLRRRPPAPTPARVAAALDGLAARAAIGLPAAAVGLDDDAARRLVPARRARCTAAWPLADRRGPARPVARQPRHRRPPRRGPRDPGRAQSPGCCSTPAGWSPTRRAAGWASRCRPPLTRRGRRLARGLPVGRATDPAGGRAGTPGDALLLLHDPALLGVVDAWLASVAPAVFDDVLPLLRRTFGGFPAPERRAVGEHVRRPPRRRPRPRGDAATRRGRACDPGRAGSSALPLASPA